MRSLRGWTQDCSCRKFKWERANVVVFSFNITMLKRVSSLYSCQVIAHYSPALGLEGELQGFLVSYGSPTSPWTSLIYFDQK